MTCFVVTRFTEDEEAGWRTQLRGQQQGNSEEAITHHRAAETSLCFPHVVVVCCVEAGKHKLCFVLCVCV